MSRSRDIEHGDAVVDLGRVSNGIATQPAALDVDIEGDGVRISTCQRAGPSHTSTIPESPHQVGERACIQVRWQSVCHLSCHHRTRHVCDDDGVMERLAGVGRVLVHRLGCRDRALHGGCDRSGGLGIGCLAVSDRSCVHDLLAGSDIDPGGDRIGDGNRAAAGEATRPRDTTVIPCHC